MIEWKNKLLSLIIKHEPYHVIYILDHDQMKIISTVNAKSDKKNDSIGYNVTYTLHKTSARLFILIQHYNLFTSLSKPCAHRYQLIIYNLNNNNIEKMVDLSFDKQFKLKTGFRDEIFIVFGNNKSLKSSISFNIISYWQRIKLLDKSSIIPIEIYNLFDQFYGDDTINIFIYQQVHPVSSIQHGTIKINATNPEIRWIQTFKTGHGCLLHPIFFVNEDKVYFMYRRKIVCFVLNQIGYELKNGFDEIDIRSPWDFNCLDSTDNGKRYLYVLRKDIRAELESWTNNVALLRIDKHKINVSVLLDNIDDYTGGGDVGCKTDFIHYKGKWILSKECEFIGGDCKWIKKILSYLKS